MFGLCDLCYDSNKFKSKMSVHLLIFLMEIFIVLLNKSNENAAQRTTHTLKKSHTRHINTIRI